MREFLVYFVKGTLFFLIFKLGAYYLFILVSVFFLGIDGGFRELFVSLSTNIFIITRIRFARSMSYLYISVYLILSDCIMVIICSF